MQQLELRTYTRNEMSTHMGIPLTNGQFARDLKKKLDKCGYSYEKIGNKFYKITGIPQSIELRLKELLVRCYKFDNRSTVKNYATFIFLMMHDELFADAPWDTKLEIAKEHGVRVEYKQLSLYAQKLISAGILHRCTSNNNRWKTELIDGKKVQKRVCLDDPNEIKIRNEYWNEHHRIMDDGTDFTTAIVYCWKKYHCCYYSSASYAICAWVNEEEGTVMNEELWQLTNLVDEYFGITI